MSEAPDTTGHRDAWAEIQEEKHKANLPILEAKKLLADEQKRREDLCAKEVVMLLEKHNCTLDVKMILGPNKYPEIVTQITSKK